MIHRSSIKAFLKSLKFNTITTISSLVLTVLSLSFTALTYFNKDNKEITYFIDSIHKIVDLESKPSLGDLSIKFGDEDIKVLYILEYRIRVIKQYY